MAKTKLTNKNGITSQFRSSDGSRIFGDFTKAQIFEAGMVLAKMEAVKESANFMVVVSEIVNSFNKIQGNGIQPYVMNRGCGALPKK